MLQIIRSESSLDIPNANRFINALCNEGFKQNIEYKIITIHKQEEIYDICCGQPSIFIQPFEYEIPSQFDWYNADENTTAKVIFDIIAEDIKYDTYTPNILLIGRGETVNKPLINMLLNNTNANLIVTNSQTSEDDLYDLLNVSDIIVCATNKEVTIPCQLNERLVFDVGNTISNIDIFHKCRIYKRGDIGKLTVQQIIKNAKEME